jgi:peptidoglycan/xylan/chitin deacetylase (PgdA/CDA1 family)
MGRRSASLAGGSPIGSGEGGGTGLTRGGAVARRLVSRGWASSLLRRIAAERGRGLALVYHRVGASGSHVIPTISEELFARQLALMTELGQIVPAEELLRPRRSDSVRFALTFDDDYSSHRERVLPILLDRRVPATFFLSGRSVFGLPRYSFEVIDDLLATGSVPKLERALGIEASDAETLLALCAADPSIAKRVEEFSQSPPEHLKTKDVAAMVAGGMTIGFHTLEHPDLTSLSDADLARAVEHGRDDIETVAGVTIRLFAYPYGRTDERVSEAVARAGYTAAFTGVPGPLTGRTRPYQVPRWEPGPLDERAFVAEMAIRLSRAVHEETS